VGFNKGDVMIIRAITALALIVVSYQFGFMKGKIFALNKTIKKLSRLTPPPCDFGQEDERVGSCD